MVKVVSQRSAGVLATQRGEKFFVNNYSLTHNGATKKTGLLFVVFERQTNEVSGWCGLSVLLSFSKSEFCWRGFGPWRDFFNYSPVFCIFRFFPNSKNMYFYEQTFQIG